MASTVLIGPPEALAKFREQPDPRTTTVFSDEETLRALDLITREKPPVIAIERTFAGSSRGVALINRIKADPSLTTCDIQIVSHDGGVTRAPERHAGDEAAVATSVLAPAAELDPRGTRRAPRIPMAEGAEMLVDGTRAALVDLSTCGAQIISTIILRPNQRLRLVLTSGGVAVRMSGTVAWASLEMPRGVAHYRAGVEFLHPDTAAIERYCAAHKRA